MRLKFYAVCIFATLFCCRAVVFAQDYSGTWGTLTERPNTPINEMINGYIEVLPAGYDANPSKHYPLIIFLEGQSQFGDGGPTELQNLYGTNEAMFPDLIRNNQFANDFTVGGTEYQFIVIIPQARKQVQTGRPLSEQMLSPEEVNDVINYALQNYRVDVNRVYLMGLSLGGGSTWNYAGASVNYANRLAAIVPFAGASDPADDANRDDNIAASNLAVWTFAGELDTEYAALAQEYIDLINGHPSHGEALITIFPGGNHNSSWTEPLQNDNTGNATYPNLFEWILSKSRSLSQPVFATVDAGADQTIELANGSTQLSEHNVSFAGGSTTLSGTASAGAGISSVEWVRVDGHGSTITNPTMLSTTVTDLKPGTNTYQLRVTDNNGLTAVDNVTVNVVAPPDNEYIKVEAEDYSGKTDPYPALDESTIDAGPAYTMGWMNNNGVWLEYQPSVPSTGSYAMYYRYKYNSGNGLTITVDGAQTKTEALTTGDWHSDSVHLVLDPASTVRVTSLGGDWNLNYLEFVLLSAESSLPVKFVYFNAECSNGAVNVRWKTAQEQNSSSFTVQRSTDGANWSDIGSVTAAGQSSSERSYVFVDRTAPGMAYYRVVEQDADGRTSVSSTVRSACGVTTQISVYPNPSSGISSLNVSLEQATPIAMQILDTRGAVVEQRQMQLPAGSTTIPLNMGSWPNGVYTINVQYNGQTKTTKIIKH